MKRVTTRSRMITVACNPIPRLRMLRYPSLISNSIPLLFDRTALYKASITTGQGATFCRMTIYIFFDYIRPAQTYATVIVTLQRHGHALLPCDWTINLFCLPHLSDFSVDHTSHLQRVIRPHRYPTRAQMTPGHSTKCRFC